MNDFVLTSGESGSPQIGSVFTDPLLGRYPVKHLLIGPQPAVNITIHRLHVLQYAHATDWSALLVLPQQQICFTPKAGDMMASLVRYLKLD